MSLSQPLLESLTAMGFRATTPIQAATIPVALLGHDPDSDYEQYQGQSFGSIDGYTTDPNYSHMAMLMSMRVNIKMDRIVRETRFTISRWVNRP